MALPIVSDRAFLAGVFFNQLEMPSAALSLLSELTTYVRSTQPTESYKWLEAIPGLQLWTGQRSITTLESGEFSISSFVYENGLEIPRDDARDDSTGQVATRMVEDFAVRAAEHPIETLSTLIEAGAASVCHDGQFMYDTDHPIDGGTQSNDISVDISALPVSQHGSTTSPSIEELMLAIYLGVIQIVGLKDKRAKPINRSARSFGVLVPLNLMMAAGAAAGVTTVSGGQLNPLQAQQTFQLLVEPSPDLSWTDQFLVWRRDGTMRPYIFQEREGTKFDFLGEGSEENAKNRRHLALVERTYGMGYGRYTTCCLVTLT